MVYVKLLRDTYGGLNYLKNACYYPAKYEKIASEELCGLGGYGVNYMEPEAAYRQMRLVKIFYGKECSNPLIHYMISYDADVKDADNAREITGKIAGYFTERYQLIWGVHHVPRGCSGYHAHIILNSVSYVDGRMYHSDMSEIKRFCRFVEQNIGSHVRLVGM